VQHYPILNFNSVNLGLLRWIIRAQPITVLVNKKSLVFVVGNTT
jgi:hypothetical protein